MPWGLENIIRLIGEHDISIVLHAEQQETNNAEFTNMIMAEIVHSLTFPPQVWNWFCIRYSLSFAYLI